jgi:hypothetical protein
MGPRRETRREYEAFKALLAGKTAAERLRLTAEHRAYLAGERDTDVLMPGPARVPRPVRLPPVGKSPAYIAALRSGMDESDEGESEEEMEFEDAVVEDAEVEEEEKAAEEKEVEEEVVGAKKTTDEKTAAREAKKAKEAAAVARAASAASRKKMAKMKERLRLEKEERRGAAARAGALAALDLQRQPAKATSKAAGNKKKRKTSPHVPAEDDQDSASESSGYVA